MALNGLYLRTNTKIISGGYKGEEYGVEEGYPDWTNVNASGSKTSKYYFRDSNVSSNNTSSRVVVTLEDSWSATVQSDNSIKITITSKVTNIKRDSVRGTPSGTRSMFIRQTADGKKLWSIAGDSIANAHTILEQDLTIGTKTFTVKPQKTEDQGTIYMRSNVTGHDKDSTPSIYVDEFGMGIQIKNTLPADYVPGKTYKASTGKWMSHDRSGGTAAIWDGSKFYQMRTINGAVGTDNPPKIKHADAWKNQRLIGDK